MSNRSSETTDALSQPTPSQPEISDPAREESVESGQKPQAPAAQEDSKSGIPRQPSDENGSSPLDRRLQHAQLRKLRLETIHLKEQVQQAKASGLGTARYWIPVLVPIITASIVLLAAYLDLRVSRDLRDEAQRLRDDAHQTRLQTALLSHPDERVKLEAIRQLAKYDPSASERMTSDLVRILMTEGTSEELVEATSTTLVAIGTDRVVNELAGTITRGTEKQSWTALETMARIPTNRAFEQTYYYISHNDPRLSGRSKVFLAKYHPARLASSIERMPKTDYDALQDALDALTLMVGTEETDRALLSILDAPAVYKERVRGLTHPRIRALRLLYGRPLESHTDRLLRSCLDETAHPDDRAFAAFDLLTTSQRGRALKLLTDSQWGFDQRESQWDFYLQLDTNGEFDFFVAAFKEMMGSESGDAVKQVLERKAAIGHPAWAAAASRAGVSVPPEKLLKALGLRNYLVAGAAADALQEMRAPQFLPYLRRSQGVSKDIRVRYLALSPEAEDRRKAASLLVEALEEQMANTRALDISGGRFRGSRYAAAMLVGFVPMAERPVDEYLHFANSSSIHPAIRTIATVGLRGTQSQQSLLLQARSWLKQDESSSEHYSFLEWALPSDRKLETVIAMNKILYRRYLGDALFEYDLMMTGAGTADEAIFLDKWSEEVGSNIGGFIRYARVRSAFGRLAPEASVRLRSSLWDFRDTSSSVNADIGGWHWLDLAIGYHAFLRGQPRP